MTTTEPEQYETISQRTITDHGSITLTVQRDTYTGACSVGIDTKGCDVHSQDQIDELIAELTAVRSHLN